MLRAFLAALFVLFHVQLGSANPTPNQCLTEATLRNVLSAKLPEAELVSLAGLDAISFIASLNAVTPSAQIVADAVMIIALKQRADVLLAFFKNGCMVLRGMMPRAAADQLLLQLERTRA